MVKEPDVHLMKHYNDVVNYIDRAQKKNENLLDFAGRAVRAENKKRLTSKIEGVEAHLTDLENLMNESIIDFYSKHFKPKELVDDNETLHQDSFVLRYFPNIARDWFHNTGENQNYAEKLKEFGKLKGKCLVLGSGASRLAYDLAELNPELEVVATDLNYLALHIAEKINRGEQLELHHLPRYPISSDKICIKLKSEKKTSLSNLHFINCDFREIQFQTMSFDYVLAPWFFDVIEIPLEVSLSRVNSFLKSEGKMIYWGPYSFQEYGEEVEYTPEEVSEISLESGFKKIDSRIDEFPYLVDPFNAQSRMEKLFWGVYEKNKHYKLEEIRRTYKKTPDWILDHSQVIPLDQDILNRKQVYDLYNQIYQEIDGKVTLKSLSKEIAKKLGMEPAQIKALLELHFEKVYQDLISS